MEWFVDQFAKQPIPLIVASLGVLSTTLMAFISLLGIKSNASSLASKDAQIQMLKSQIEDQAVFSAKEFLVQHKAQIDLYTRENSRLKDEVRELVVRLRGLETAVTDEQRSIASLMGVGRILGITETELTLRRLSGFIMPRGVLRDFGEFEPWIFEFYLDAMGVFVPDQEVAKSVAHSTPEYILDFAILPVLVVARQPNLKDRALELATMIAQAMSGTPLEWEMDIYMEAIKLAEIGEDFSSGLPDDLRVKMLGAPPKSVQE